MTNKNSLLRYLLIDVRLRKEPRPGLEQLKKFVQEQFKEITNEKMIVSRITIKRDVKNMRKMFFAPINFSFEKNQYHYEYPNYTFLKLPENQIERLIYNIKLQYLLGVRFNSDQNIQFETTTSTRGWEHVPMIAKAISKKRVVSFTYKSINSKRNRDYLINPLLLKENRNSFYLLGTKDKSSEIRTFALDRIVDTVGITDTEAEVDKDFDAEKYFVHSIGITAQNKKPIEIVLSFTPKQASYLKSKPLHRSQKILVNDDKSFQIQIKVEPTYEVIANILSYGQNVEVVSPEDFRNLIADRLNSAYKRYLKQGVS